MVETCKRRAVMRPQSMLEVAGLVHFERLCIIRGVA